MIFYRTAFFLILVLSSLQSYAQMYVEISGPPTSNLDEQKTYNATFYSGTPPAAHDSFWELSSPNEIMISSDFSITVKWKASGVQTLEYEMTTWDNYYWDDFSITVASSGIASPVATSATDILTNEFTATWGTVTGASSYRLDVSLSSNFTTFISGYNNFPLSALNKTISGLAPGTNYYYRVRAINAGGTVSLNSNSMEVMTTPAAPVLLSASNVTSTSFDANWETTTGAQWYTLEVSEQSSFDPIQVTMTHVTSNNANVNNLFPTKTYYYRMRAVNVYGRTSVNSSTSTVTTLSNSSPPQAPLTNPASNITSSSFTANWSAPLWATEYKLDVSTTSDFSTFVHQNLSVSGTNYNVTNLNLKTKYYYRVRAQNSYGISQYSAAILAVNLDQNYLRSTNITVAGKTTIAQAESAQHNQKITNYQFFDGLGRLEQTVSVNGSPLQNDIVSPIQYDVYGRETKKILPYVDANENNGWFKVNALGDAEAIGSELDKYRTGKQYEFYQLGGHISADQYPYAETRFESSPLNRVLKQGAVGTSWQPDGNDSYASTDHTVKFSYEFNGISEVIYFTLDEQTDEIAMESLSHYQPNQLYKNKTLDEHNNEVIEFKDKEGKTVLKKVQYKEENGIKLYAETYYVYDDFGNLITVFPPEATKAIKAQSGL